MPYPKERESWKNAVEGNMKEYERTGKDTEKSTKNV
jgi:hypothetical protein